LASTVTSHSVSKTIKNQIIKDKEKTATNNYLKPRSRLPEEALYTLADDGPYFDVSSHYWILQRTFFNVIVIVPPPQSPLISNM